MTRASWPMILLAVLAPASGMAQNLARRVAAVENGTVAFQYATRPDVCGNGEDMVNWGRHRHRGSWRVGGSGDCPCTHGPARITLEITEGRITDIDVVVSDSEDRPVATELGPVPAREAASWLLTVAADPRHPAAHKAVFPVVLADSMVSWNPMLALARNRSAPKKSRSQAVFWLSQAAGDSATAGLSELAQSESEDREVRRQAVFALSQLPEGKGVEPLIRVVTGNKDPEIRKNAMFWLGQSEDPRALALIERLLTGK